MFRIYYKNWRSKNEIKEELRLLNYLKEHSISVSFPVKDCTGNYIQHIPAIEGKRLAVLFSFIDGDSIRVPSEKICYNFGITMANMHQLTIQKKVNRKNYNAETLVVGALKLAKTQFSESSYEMQYFERATIRICSEFDKADSKNLRYGIVHLDLWYENMKIKNESEISIFDFDNCGNGWLFLDIAYSLMLLFRNESNKENYTKKKKEFLKGYTSVCTISKEEERLLPYGGLAIWLHYTGIHVQRFDDFSNQFLSNEFLKYWIHTVNQWMEFNKIKI